LQDEGLIVVVEGVSSRVVVVYDVVVAVVVVCIVVEVNVVDGVVGGGVVDGVVGGAIVDGVVVGVSRAMLQRYGRLPLKPLMLEPLQDKSFH